MQEDMIQPLIDNFFQTIELLIKDFSEFTFDEKALGFLATRTRNFITFCDLTFNTIVPSLLGKTINYSLDDEIHKSNEIVEEIFDSMNHSLNHILEHNHEEENHVHDHSHEHHIHIDVDAVQGDVDKLLNDLNSLKRLFDGIFKIVMSSVSFQSKNLDDYEFKKDYLKFKNFIDEFNS